MVRYPGTIAMSPELVAQLYEELCAEAARNGFTKIIFLISHGGSEDVTHFAHHAFLHRRLHEEWGFSVFDLWFYSYMRSDEVLESKPEELGHGGEKETSLVLHFRPELVDLDELEPLPEGKGPYYPKTVARTWYPIDWIKQVPRGYVGMPHISTAQNGALMADSGAEACAEIVSQIKKYDPERDR